ncbi:GIY-YIG nuclease family protein [Candidatus Roizmanbacteria bacterium]|nr:GIY-YIG nuclease family protein [Candidatus Roizmanbacteria bacterium]
MLWACSSTPIESGSTGRAVIRKSMKGWMYILRSDNSGKYYIGSTNNLEKRLKQHRNNTTRTTRILQAYTLVYCEEHEELFDARKREKQLKSYKSHKYIDWIISGKGL